MIKFRLIVLKLFCCIAGILLFTRCSTIIKSRVELKIPEKTLILSFDDGPNPHSSVTVKVLEILKKYKIRAFFSLIGKNVENSPGIVKQIADDGHIIVNHSYNHDASSFSSKLSIEIRKCDEAIGSALCIPDYKSLFFRPPAGIITSEMADDLKSLGMKLAPITYFNFDSDAKPCEQERVVKEIIYKIKHANGGMIVLHDGYAPLIAAPESEYDEPGKTANRSWIPQALEQIILYFLNQGYTIGIPEMFIGDPGLWAPSDF